MNYIVTQVAKPEENKVPQMQNSSIKSVDDAMDIYIKNAIVCLASAKIYNPDAVCVLNCNFDIPNNLKSIADRAGIEIHAVPYGKYKSREEYRWAITQYKFDSMGHILEIMDEEDQMVLLDTDTVCVRGMQEVFDESKKGLLLYNACHGYQHENRQRIICNYRKLYNLENANLVHYGGEFFAGTKAVLQKFLSYCEEVIVRARAEKDLIPWDDEHIISIAAEHFMKGSIYQGNPYIHRYWTNRFYLVSTNYHYNPVCIWHLPAEKNYGMIVLFEYFVDNRCFPDADKIAKIMGFPEKTYKRWNLYRWKMRLRNKRKSFAR